MRACLYALSVCLAAALAAACEPKPPKPKTHPITHERSF
jgi:hypothetical protein